MALYIGLMSGTSMDGVDAVLARIGSPAPAGLAVLGHYHQPMPAALRSELMALNVSGADELHRAALASNAVAELYGQAVHSLLDAQATSPAQVRAIGAHGQTVRHRPGEFVGTGYTCQLLNGALLAERCGIDVVCDFRSRDVAAGGQGAPLVPAFHAAMWSEPGRLRAVLNIGGIANLSLLGSHGEVGGFDCGPGNALMDLWCERHLGQAFDDGGAWAAGAQPDPALLQRLLSDPYFQRPPPKSTGRDLFNADWLDRWLGSSDRPPLEARKVQATLVELTVQTVADSLRQHAAGCADLLVCGGGALNAHLMQRLAAALPTLAVRSTEPMGLPPLQVEAAAFAWLAHAHVNGQAGNRPEVTGAAGLRRLGALYPAR